jgi:hypothetical protein
MALASLLYGWFHLGTLQEKMYKVAFLLLGVIFVSLLLVEAIFSSEVVSNVTILAMYVGFAMNANAIYYRYLKN